MFATIPNFATILNFMEKSLWKVCRTNGFRYFGRTNLFWYDLTDIIICVHPLENKSDWFGLFRARPCCLYICGYCGNVIGPEWKQCRSAIQPRVKLVNILNWAKAGNLFNCPPPPQISNWYYWIKLRRPPQWIDLSENKLTHRPRGIPLRVNWRGKNGQWKSCSMRERII